MLVSSLVLCVIMLKEFKHTTACEAIRRDFMPFIVSTDSFLGKQAEAFLKRLARDSRAKKWHTVARVRL